MKYVCHALILHITHTQTYTKVVQFQPKGNDTSENAFRCVRNPIETTLASCPSLQAHTVFERSKGKNFLRFYLNSLPRKYLKYLLLAMVFLYTGVQSVVFAARKKVLFNYFCRSKYIFQKVVKEVGKYVRQMLS